MQIKTFDLGLSFQFQTLQSTLEVICHPVNVDRFASIPKLFFNVFFLCSCHRKVRDKRRSVFIMQCVRAYNNRGLRAWLWKWTIIHYTALKLYYLPW